MIFDALNNNIALYDIRDASNANPLDRYIIRNHYKSILEDYFN
ncbi:hypothetical protein SDC9_194458 [bioreactor metagenome]|uniref:Uncharacterized protein n=1 Tax=bioreactor metagenome TaxID=1076179 RepID=A0A645I8W5_9ZZZZ